MKTEQSWDRFSVYVSRRSSQQRLSQPFVRHADSFLSAVIRKRAKANIINFCIAIGQWKTMYIKIFAGKFPHIFKRELRGKRKAQAAGERKCGKARGDLKGGKAVNIKRHQMTSEWGNHRVDGWIKGKFGRVIVNGRFWLALKRCVTRPKKRDHRLVDYNSKSSQTRRYESQLTPEGINGAAE